MATWFKTVSGQYYVEVVVPKLETANNNIICCVDVSGSMSGAPIKNVCTVLRDIYNKTKIAYPLFSYNTVVNRTTIQEVEKKDLVADGGTSFGAIFDAIKNHLLTNIKPTTFIFMTDGQDTSSDSKGLAKSIQTLKLLISGMKSISITFHTIGFGDVNNDFLNNQVRKFGNKEGLFRYSTQSTELQNSFNDMFEFASSSREFTLKIGSKTYTANSNDESLGILIDDSQIEPLTEIILISDDGTETKLPLSQLESIRPIHFLKALNLVSPENEEKVREILTQVNSIQRTGADLVERLEVEQIKKEITDRMMEYISLFTQLKMGQVPEQVKLKLSALRHDATFSNLQRKRKLELRVNKNVEYFKKTDISGILDGYKKEIDKNRGWDLIKEHREDWQCTYSKDDIYEIMRKSTDNILCVGILVERDEEAIESPTKGLKLINVSNTLISFDSFILAMNLATQKALEGGDVYGQFSGIKNTFCIVGETREKINAVIPLYINFEHMKRIRILEGIWLGHLFTLDSYGYDKNQEIGLLKLLHDIIRMRIPSERGTKIIQEIEKVCKFIITESIGFKHAYGELTYEKFVSSTSGRNSLFDLCIPLMIGYLKEEVERVIIPVFYECIKKHLCDTFKNVDTTEIVKRLLYGTEITTLVVPTEKEIVNNPDNPDYAEETFIKYFFDEQIKPVNLIPETYNKARKAIADVDSQYVKSLIPEVPELIKGMLIYCKMDPEYVEKNLNTDDLRKEILIMLNYEIVPPHITKENILSTVDNKMQGNSLDVVKFDLTPENIKFVVYKIVTAKTLPGFGGLMRKYCPKRCGEIFHCVVSRLVLVGDNEVLLAREKLIALLTNQINYGPFYCDLEGFCWQPLVDISDLNRVVGEDELIEIEKRNFGKRVVHCYRLSNIPNRHCNSNFNPNMNYLFNFRGYRHKQ